MFQQETLVRLESRPAEEPARPLSPRLRDPDDPRTDAHPVHASSLTATSDTSADVAGSNPPGRGPGASRRGPSRAVGGFERDQALDPFDAIDPPAPKPASMLVTLKLSSIFTVTMHPFDFRTCAS